MKTKPNILFLCTGNSCRSQIAEGLMKNLCMEKFNVFSAGTAPSKVNIHAIKVMDELNIDIRDQKSENVDLYHEKTFEFVVTVCNDAKDHCPNFSGGGEKIHWPITDPFSGWDYDQKQLNNFRKTRDSIKEKIDLLLNTWSMKNE